MSIVDRLEVKRDPLNRSKICRELVRRNLSNPAEQFLDRTGKRIRSSVVDLAFEISGGSGQVPPCLGEAIEWLHAGSLVIDDIQDESPLRRGHPSLHMQIGVPLALNAGNWMYFQALEKLFDDSIGRSMQNRLLQQIVRTALRCHRGQSLDLGSQVNRIDPSCIQNVVAETSRLKTGSLVSMAATFGAVAAGANLRLRESLSRFGMHVGIALQMRNDLEELRSMTYESSEFKTIRMEDLRNARITWPWAWAYSVCSPSDFAALIKQLTESREDPRVLTLLANQLLSQSETKGEVTIQRKLNRHFRELEVHDLNPKALAEMKNVLARISSSGRDERKDIDARIQ